MPNQHRSRAGVWATRAAYTLTGLGLGKWALSAPQLVTTLATLGPLGLVLTWVGVLAARRGRADAGAEGQEPAPGR